MTIEQYRERAIRLIQSGNAAMGSNYIVADRSEIYHFSVWANKASIAFDELVIDADERRYVAITTEALSARNWRTTFFVADQHHKPPS